MKHKTQKMT